jgi:vitamin B12 transporter
MLLALMTVAPTSLADEGDGRTVIVDERAEGDEAASETVVTRAEMDDALSDLGEVLDRQPGMRITRLGGLGSYATASVRGSTAEQVLVLLDGIPLVSTEGGPVDLAMLPLGLLRRITITRGTSPAAFGVSAIGGVIDLRLREPLGTLFEVEVGGGSFDTRGARTFIGFGDGESGAGFALDYQGSEGDFPYTHGGGTAWDASDNALTTRENNGFDHVTALARGRLVLNDWLTIQAIDVVSWRRREIPGIAIYEAGWATMETLRHTLGSHLRVALGWTPNARLHVLPWLSWSSSDLQVTDGGLSLGGGSSRAGTNAQGARLHLSVPFALNAEDTWRLEPSITVAYRHEAYAGRGVVENPTDALRHRLATAAEVTLDAGPLNTSVIVSGRFEGTWTETSERPLTEGMEGSGRVGVAYEAAPGTVLRANVSQGARFPTPFELFGFTAMTRGNAALDPERGLTLDGGLRHDAPWLPPGSYGALELSAFASWTDGLIQFVRNSQGVSRPENIAAALIAGLEVGLWCDLWAHLRLRTNLTWSHSEDRSPIVARQGKKLPYRPTWKTYARAEAYLHLPAAGEAGLALEVEHIAGDVLDHANLIENPARITFGLAAWLEFLNGQMRLALNLRNLMDAKLLDFQGYPLPGPTVMGTLRWTPNVD